VLRSIWSLNPNRDWKSRLASLRHNLWLMFETFVVSSAVTGLWAFCYKCKWPFHVHQETDLVMINTAVVVCAAIFAFVAATLFAQVRQRAISLSRAILLHDKPEFMLNRDEKVQIMMHVVVGFFGFSVLALSAVVAYSELWVGALIIFLESACIVVFFISMFEMQDIRNSAWFNRHTPEGWMTEDAITFFTELRNKKAQAAEMIGDNHA
jgi:hypothetical protein